MLTLIGCNHRSAPLALRERLAFSEQELPAALDRLLSREGIEEGLILSTCNRVEVLVRLRASKEGTERLTSFLGEERGLTPKELQAHCYHFQGREVVRHLFEVAGGLDSMILGEPQILGQVKQAYRVAKRAGATGAVLDRLLQQCLASAKRVRTETGISRHAVSVAYAAVNLARQIFGGLEGRKALLLGAGKMAELVARHLVSNGVAEVAVASRTYNRAMASAERFNGRPLQWKDGLSRLGEFCIVVSCTGASQPILHKPQVAHAVRQRRGKPLFLIDIGVPRDIDPQVNELDNVYLYDIDGLQGVIDANLGERRRAAGRARLEIEHDVDAFERWRQSLEITPTLVSLRESLLGIGRRELERYRSRLGPASPNLEETLEQMTRSMIQKILHRPVAYLRNSVDRGDIASSTSAYREIFGLDPPGDAPPRGGRRKHTASQRESSSSAGPQRLLKGGKDR